MGDCKVEELLVEEYRGDVLECMHRGHICGFSDSGEVSYSIGDEDIPVFLRSSAKPIQAIPIVKYGLMDKYNLSDKEITIITGSHRAQPFHVEALESMMKKIDITEEDLVCLPTYPLSPDARKDLIRANMSKRTIYHNCSGKHMGILTICKYLGCSIDDYWDINSPAQQDILDHVAIIADYPREDVKIGVDGCGVPVFAMPLKYLAKTFMRMACPDLIEDSDVRMAVMKITKLMNENHDMVSGTGLICSLLLMDPNIVAKGGAKGVYCFGLKEERLGFAIKIMDGSEEEWPMIVASILEQINYKNKDTIERLYKAFPLEVKNDNNKIVGVSKMKFKLDTKSDKVP